ALDGEVAGVATVNGKHRLVEQVLLDGWWIPPALGGETGVIGPPAGLLLDPVERAGLPRLGAGGNENHGVRPDQLDQPLPVSLVAEPGLHFRGRLAAFGRVG